MKILVTGAAGFIGTHLFSHLTKRQAQHTVTGIDHLPLHEWELPGLTWREQQVCDVVCDEIPYFDVCYHLAAEARIQPSFGRPLDYIRTNVIGTASILEKAKECGGTVIYAGSSTADDDPMKNPYALSKYQGEQLCKLYAEHFGVPTAIARFYNVYGPGQVEEGEQATVLGIWLKQHRDGKPLTITGDGSQKRDFTHVEDIVAGLVAIASKGAKNGIKYSLGTGRNIPILEVARMITSAGLTFIPGRPGESYETLADVLSTKVITGWQATRRLEDFIKDALGY